MANPEQAEVADKVEKKAGFLWGFLPKETIFKFSVFGGYCSAAGAKVIEWMGVNSDNAWRYGDFKPTSG